MPTRSLLMPSAVPLMRWSPCVRASGGGGALAQQLQGRAEREAEGEAERRPPDVGDVHVERLGEGRLGARRHLPQTGEPLRDEEALEVVRLEVLYLVRDAGTWAHEAHVAFEHVDELRQLVEARLPQP